jgi:DNA-binding IclR family transcriptional regulator
MLNDNAARVLHALERTSSARRLDLMHTCHLTRGEVHEALDELKRAGLVNSIASGARFVARERAQA